MASQTREVDIAFGIDERFAHHASAVIVSVVQCAPLGRFRFIILHTGISCVLQQRIESVAPGQRFLWIEVGDDDVPPFPDQKHFTRATLFRVGLEKLAPQDVKKIIYLDADIAVTADVRKLAAVDLAEAPLAAVADPNVSAEDFRAKWHLKGSADYFNAGILLIDLEKVRTEALFSKAITFIAAHGYELPWNDQDALNWVLWGRWKKLDTIWNVQRSMAIAGVALGLPPEMRVDGWKPAIIHFTGSDKPWKKNAYHPWSHLYWASLRKTPFFDDVIAMHGISRQARLRMFIRYLVRWPWSARAI